MFIGKKVEKEIVMQLDLDPEKFWEEGLSPFQTEIPESLLVCSDGSVIVGFGEEDIRTVCWYPCFEMIKFYSDKFNIENYIPADPNVNSISISYLIAGPPPAM